MIYTFEYRDDVERDKIIADNSAKYLIEERNIKEGNFLLFTDSKPVDIEVRELKQQLQITQEAIDFLIMNGGI